MKLLPKSRALHALRLLGILALALACFGLVPDRSRAKASLQTRQDLAQGVNLAIQRYGLDIGAWIYVEHSGVVYERQAQRRMPGASAIKCFIVFDLLRERQDVLGRPFPQLTSRLEHPAFSGFTPEGMRDISRTLEGKTYWDLASITMGRGGYGVEVYNAACNLLLVDLGGPGVVSQRIRRLSPAFRGLDLHRYMEQWHGRGDNMVTPKALASFYLQLSQDALAGATPQIQRQLRSLLARQTDAPRVFEKSGTLYPSPMARIRAGYLEREEGNLVYAIMGEMRDPKHLELPDAFVLLLASMDTLTTIIQEVF